MRTFLNSLNITILISIVLVFLSLGLRTFYFENWDEVMSWDFFAYYVYLPAIFIYNDPGLVDQSVIDHIFQTYTIAHSKYQIHQLPNGNWSSMYSLGMAILYLPFFLIGDVIAVMTEYQRDGFSLPYQISIGMGMLVYIVLGLFIIRRVLVQFFSEKVTSIVLLLLFFGTNYFHQSVINCGAPHAVMFTLMSLVFYLTCRWYKEQSVKNSVFLGAIIGLTFLARANSFTIFLVPVLWGIYNKESFLKQIVFLKEKWQFIAIALASFFIFPSVQFIFWKVITGSFFFNPYAVTPGFDWLGPQFDKVLFSYLKGWWLYTPLMMFAAVGLYHLWVRNKTIASGVIAAFLVNLYVLACWGTWWGGGGFGARYFVESYAFSVIPLGYFVEAFADRKRIMKWIIQFVILVFVFFNLFQTWQFNNWFFDGYSMNGTYYWEIFLKTSVTDEQRKLNEIQRSFKETETFSNENDYNARIAGNLDFENENTIDYNTSYIDTSYYFSGPNSYRIDSTAIYGPTYRFVFNELTKKEHAWVRISFKFLPMKDLTQSPAYLVCLLEHNNGKYIDKYRGFDISKEPYEIGKWNTYTKDYLTPYPLNDSKDKIIVYPYISNNNILYIDDFKIEVFERKW